MIKCKDFFERDIKEGDAVIVEDASNLTIGRVSHYTKAGNLLILAKVSTIHNNDRAYRRTIISHSSSHKVLLTNDPLHVSYISDIKIKGES